jgi:hypothetical protein
MVSCRSVVFALLLVTFDIIAFGQSGQFQEPLTGAQDPGVKQITGCTAMGQKVIADLHIGAPVSCKEFPVKATEEDVTMVIVLHGPGMDCLAGCIWQETVGIVANGKVFDAPNEPSDGTMIGFMRQGFGDWCGVPVGETGLYTSFDGGRFGRFTYAATFGGGSFRHPGHGNEPRIDLAKVSDTSYGWLYRFAHYSTEKPLRDKFLTKWELFDSAAVLGQPTACIIDGDLMIMRRKSGSGLMADAQKLSVQLMPLVDFPERTIEDYIGACQKPQFKVQTSEVLCLSYLGKFSGIDAACRRMPETTVGVNLVLRRQECVDAAIGLRKRREQEYPVLK